MREKVLADGHRRQAKRVKQPAAGAAEKEVNITKLSFGVHAALIFPE